MKNLKVLREKKRLSQADLAKILKTTQQAISLYEQSKRESDYETQNMIATFFDVSIDYLLGRVDDPEVKIVPNELLPGELAKYVDYIQILKDADMADISPEELKEVIEIAKKIKAKD